MIYCFWFLKSAFFCCILFYISNKYCPIKWFGLVISLFISQFITTFQINLMYPCFLFGLLINKNFNLIKCNSKIITLISGAIFISMLLFWDAEFWDIPNRRLIIQTLPDFSLASEYTYKIGYRICIGLMGTLFYHIFI